MKSLSNVIPFDFVLKIKFNRDFILKRNAKKSEHLRGKSEHFRGSVTLLLRVMQELDRRLREAKQL